MFLFHARRPRRHKLFSPVRIGSRTLVNTKHVERVEPIDDSTRYFYREKKKKV